MHMNDGEPFGHTPSELRQGEIRRDLRDIELQRSTCRGAVLSKRSRKSASDDLHAAFSRAEREQAELRRLKDSGKPLCQLEFVGAFGYDAERLDV